jgi:uncharacterized protein (TIGR03000 family)
MRETTAILTVLVLAATGFAQPSSRMTGSATPYDTFRALNAGRPPGPNFGLYSNNTGGFPRYGSMPYPSYLHPSYSRLDYGPGFYPYPRTIKAGPDTIFDEAPRARPMPPPRDLTALLSLRVPRAAEVFINDDKSPQTGSYRMFVTPPLPPGETKTYYVKIRWTQDGKTIERSKKIELHSGEVLRYDYLEDER